MVRWWLIGWKIMENGISLKMMELWDKMISNVREVSIRGGNIVVVVNEGDETSKEVVDLFNKYFCLLCYKSNI